MTCTAIFLLGAALGMLCGFVLGAWWWFNETERE